MIPSAMSAGLVPFALATRAAHPWLPTLTRPGRVFIGPGGQALIARADGGADLIHLGGRPHAGIAADPHPQRSTP